MDQLTEISWPDAIAAIETYVRGIRRPTGRVWGSPFFPADDHIDQLEALAERLQRLDTPMPRQWVRTRAPNSTDVIELVIAVGGLQRRHRPIAENLGVPCAMRVEATAWLEIARRLEATANVLSRELDDIR